MNTINNLSQLSSTALGGMNGAAANKPSSDASFKNLLLESIDQVNSMQVDANKAVEQLVTGGDVNPAEVLTAVQKADLSFRMMLQIRNKLETAYQQIQDIKI